MKKLVLGLLILIISANASDKLLCDDLYQGKPILLPYTVYQKTNATKGIVVGVSKKHGLVSIKITDWLRPDLSAISPIGEIIEIKCIK